MTRVRPAIQPGVMAWAASTTGSSPISVAADAQQLTNRSRASRYHANWRHTSGHSAISPLQPHMAQYEGHDAGRQIETASMAGETSGTDAHGLALSQLGRQPTLSQPGQGRRGLPS
ncbi:hypothetical protein [Aeromonas molluscorum]|uniref:Uncharacterized protein n=1 Tax=Aeromonas molluscorum 848 TaxID=1268236 RepID=R1GXQ7_9GAMM|nr:hypothetical protein G113_04388 [Aeromonas molluscorum 848]